MLTSPAADATETSTSGSGQNRSGHLPGLDALRALAVAAVVLFHLGVPWMRGGYLGVSLFFTLSGFLITRNLLTEHDRHGSIRLRSFWGRRARRLLPASWLTVFAVTATASVMYAIGRSIGFRPVDALAALTSLSNWQFLRAGNSYATVFASPSPLLHFWSLAIEEQTYLFLPLVVAALWRGQRRAIRLAGVAAAAASVSFLLPMVFDFGVDRTYYGTDTRVGEILVGVLLAVWWQRRSAERSPASAPLLAIGTAALVLFVALCVTVPQGTRALTNGLLPLVAVTSMFVVAAGASPKGWLAAVGRWRPVAALGAASYGVYLFHWPVIVVLRSLGVDTGRVLIGVLLIGAVWWAATVSLQRFETPIRVGRWPVRRATSLAVTALIAIVGLCVFVPSTPSAATDLLLSLEDAQADFNTVDADDTADPAGTGRPAAVSSTSDVEASPTSDEVASDGLPTSSTIDDAEHVPSMRFFGDSIMLSLVLAVDANSGIEVVTVADDEQLGCGIASFAEPDERGPIVSCGDPMPAWTASLVARPVDAAVVLSCQWEHVDRRLPGLDGQRVPGDPEYDAHVRDAYVEAIDAFLAGGVDAVLWVRCPQASRSNGFDGIDPRLADARDPARNAANAAVLEQAVAQRPDEACIVDDFADWVDAQVDDAHIRPDGVHYEWREQTGTGDAFVAALLEAWSRCTS